MFTPNEAVSQCNTTAVVARVGTGVTLLLTAITQHGQIPARLQESEYPLYRELSGKLVAISVLSLN